MKLLISSKSLQEAFLTCMNKYDKFYCSVAWAGNPDKLPIGKQIIKNHEQIAKVIVGLHFYQTHPDFIERFRDHKGVRFIKETDGVFHDKIYMFVTSPKKWAAIVGSSNLTKGGFAKNSECNVWFSNNDDNDGIMYKSLIRHIESNWDKASYFDAMDLDNYRESYNQQQTCRDMLKKITRLSKRTTTGTNLLSMTWSNYCDKLKSRNDLSQRLNVLNIARALFGASRSFYDLDEFDRKRISGYRLKEAEDWRFFGSVSKGEILSEMIDERIGKAIDCIPLEGEVSKTQYDKYVQLFCDGGKWKDPIGSATRLLAMKRPDVFLCVNGGNKPGLAKGLGIPQSQIALDNYWDKIILPIQGAAWYNEDPQNAKQEIIFRNRVALLDSILRQRK